MNALLRRARSWWWEVALGKASRIHTALSGDRGDVPGWVLVTVMSAGIVAGLWVVADAQLSNVLTRAIESVSK